MSRLPGGPVLAAAMRPASSTLALSSSAALTRPEGPTGTATSTGTGVPGLTGSTSSGDPSMDQMMTQDADQNLYYLKLQEQMRRWKVAVIPRFPTCSRRVTTR